MNFGQFAKSSERFWKQHFAEVDKLHSQGGFQISDEDAVVYPTTMNVVETPTHYILDFVGATEGPSGLDIRRSKQRSTDDYLGGADVGNALFALTTDNEFRNMSCGTIEAWRRFDQAHPFLRSGKFMPGRLNAGARRSASSTSGTAIMLTSAIATYCRNSNRVSSSDSLLRHSAF